MNTTDTECILKNLEEIIIIKTDKDMKIQVVYNVPGRQYIAGLEHYVCEKKTFDCNTAEELLAKYPAEKLTQGLMNALNEFFAGNRDKVAYVIKGIGIGNALILKY